MPNEYDLLAWGNDFYNYIQLQTNTTEREIVTALTSFRYSFEVSSPQNHAKDLNVVGEKIKQFWNASDATTQFNEGKTFHWFLRSQQGYIEGAIIYFDDSDLRFAAKFAVWCRAQLMNDQTLTTEARYYLEPVIHVETELTSHTMENELYDFLMKSFPREQS
jgi:hypothetical protein